MQEAEFCSSAHDQCFEACRGISVHHLRDTAGFSPARTDLHHGSTRGLAPNSASHP
jgi:hypothetical protein